MNKLKEVELKKVKSADFKASKSWPWKGIKPLFLLIHDEKEKKKKAYSI